MGGRQISEAEIYPRTTIEVHRIKKARGTRSTPGESGGRVAWSPSVHGLAVEAQTEVCCGATRQPPPGPSLPPRGLSPLPALPSTHPGPRRPKKPGGASPRALAEVPLPLRQLPFKFFARALTSRPSGLENTHHNHVHRHRRVRRHRPRHDLLVRRRLAERPRRDHRERPGQSVSLSITRTPPFFPRADSRLSPPLTRPPAPPPPTSLSTTPSVSSATPRRTRRL